MKKNSSATTVSTAPPTAPVQDQPAATPLPPLPEAPVKPTFEQMVEEIGAMPEEKDFQSTPEFTIAKSDWRTAAIRWQSQYGKVESPGNGNGNGNGKTVRIIDQREPVNKIDQTANRSTFASASPVEVVRKGKGSSSAARARAKTRYEQLMATTRPQNNFHPGRLTNVHTGVYGDAALARGSCAEVYGRFEADLIIELDGVTGSVSDKHDLCTLKGEISNALGRLLGVTGNASNILSPVNFTNWGDVEEIEKRLVTFRELVGLARKAEQENRDNDTVKKAWQHVKDELDRVTPQIKEFRCHLDKVTTSSFSDDTQETADEYREAYGRMFEEAKKDKDPRPIGGPLDPAYHPVSRPGDPKKFSHLVARYPEFDGRSDAEKARRIPLQPVIRKRSDEVWEAELYYRYGHIRVDVVSTDDAGVIVEDGDWLFQVPYFRGIGKIETIRSPRPKETKPIHKEERAQMAKLSDKELARTFRQGLEVDPEPSDELLAVLEARRKPLPSRKEVFPDEVEAPVKLEEEATSAAEPSATPATTSRSRNLLGSLVTVLTRRD